MKHLLIFLAIVLILYLVYSNINIVEGKKGKRRGRKKRKRKPFMAWDGDKYKSCEKCCNDDDGCYDSRCHKKCSKSSFKRGDGTKKRGPVKP